MPFLYPQTKIVAKMGKGGQIWLKCFTMDLIVMIRDKNDIFERVKKNANLFGMELPLGRLKGIVAWPNFTKVSNDT